MGKKFLVASFFSFTSAFELLVYLFAAKGGLPYRQGNQNTATQQALQYNPWSPSAWRW